VRTRIRVRTAMAAQTREQGRYLGGRPPYGYRLADAGPYPNKAHAAWGRRAHRLEPDAGWSRHRRSPGRHVIAVRDGYGMGANSRWSGSAVSCRLPRTGLTCALAVAAACLRAVAAAPGTGLEALAAGLNPMAAARFRTVPCRGAAAPRSNQPAPELLTKRHRRPWP
jgi:hypothetical protein